MEARCVVVSVTHLYTRDQPGYTLFGRHVDHRSHVTLSSEVTLQARQRLIGGLLADVSDHDRGALKGETLTHCPADPAASPWVRGAGKSD